MRRVIRSANILLILTLMAVVPALAQKAIKRSTPAPSQRMITVVTEPGAVVYVDSVKRGKSDASGKLVGVKLGAANRVLTVRADGFARGTLNLTAASRGTVKVPLHTTGDKAELYFLKAESLREAPLNEDDRKKAIQLYNDALKLKPKFPVAHIGLARVYFDLKDLEKAADEVAEARKDRPGYAEASVIEGRIHHEEFDNELAIKSYQRAIKEARGYQPEAYTGMGIIYQEQENYPEAIKAFKAAIAQLFDTEPVVYQLLGALYEKTREFKEAIKVYEQYLKAAPNSEDAVAIRSMMEQLKIELAQNGQIN